MERRVVNPWDWQSKVGFEQAHERSEDFTELRHLPSCQGIARRAARVPANMQLAIQVFIFDPDGNLVERVK